MHGHIDLGHVPGMAVQVTRHGKVAYRSFLGSADVEAVTPLSEDAIFRVYSMSKPVTTLAVLMLYEQGAFQLDQPVADFIPAFADLRVYASGAGDDMVSVPLARPVTIHDLLTHTSGLIYGDKDGDPMERAYAANGMSFQRKRDSLAETVARLCKLPLAHQPGQRWTYGVSNDVLGYLVEILSGRAFGAFLADRIFGPLGMVDTAFDVPTAKLDRFTALYHVTPAGGMKRLEGADDSTFKAPVTLQSGGGGLVSTLDDYQRFAEMMRRRGVGPDGPLLGRKTFDLMVSNHMGGDLASRGQPHFSETTMEGIGYGLGVSVMLDPVRAKIVGSPGEFGWGGLASTAFWVDPAEDMTVVLMTQLIPSSAYTLRRELRVLTYQAVVD